MAAQHATTIEDGIGIVSKYVYKTMESPVGPLKLVGSDSGLAAIVWANDRPRRVRLEEAAEDRHHPVLVETERQLNEYFAGKRTTFTLPLDFRGTPFQKKVWQVMCDIPFGETRTYGELATQIGEPKAVRAVGAANGKNPIAIIGPCHRVISASSKLTGYAGGLEAKALLLRLEGRKVDGSHVASQRVVQIPAESDRVLSEPQTRTSPLANAGSRTQI
jgi:methylated-DNA-[protein]-cysteine S-methyltransferase